MNAQDIPAVTSRVLTAIGERSCISDKDLHFLIEHIDVLLKSYKSQAQELRRHLEDMSCFSSLSDLLSRFLKILQGGCIYNERLIF